jgi:hypothetical protein
MEDTLHQLHDVVAREGQRAAARPAAAVAPTPTPAPAPAPAREEQVRTLRVERAAADRFYAGGLKLVVARSEAARWRALELPAAIAVFALARDGAQATIGLLEGDAGPAIDAKLPPSECLALIALADESARDLEAFHGWWVRQVPETAPELLRLSGTGRADRFEQRINAALLGQLVASQQSSDRRIVSLQSALAELRETHEDTTSVLTLLREMLGGQQVAPLRSALALHPGTATLGPPRDGAEFTVRQRLPIHSQGLAALALHVAAPRTRGNGRLLVRLLAVESASTLISWAIPYDQLHSGWNVMEIPSIIAGPRRSVELVLHWTGEGRGAPHVSLSDQLVGRGGRAQIEDGRGENASVGSSRALDRAIALQAWSGLPGGRITAAAFAQAGEAFPNTAAGRQVFVSASRLAEARLVQPRNLKLGFELLTLLDQNRVLQLHPIAGQVSVAVIPATCPPGMKLAMATVKTDCPQAPPVEYAFSWVPAGRVATVGADGTLQAEGARFSGWTRVPPNTVGSVMLSLDDPTEDAGDIYIATRVPPGATDSFAWARWLDIRIDLR